MKINLNKIFGIMMLSLLLLSTMTANAASLSNYQGFDTLEEALIDSYGEDYESYLEQNRYEVEVAQKVEDFFKDNYGEEYPSYYSGMYISEDSKNLILQIVEENLPQKNDTEYILYTDLINLDKSIMVEYVDYSYAEINGLIELINSNDDVMKDVNYIAFDVINNNIAVELSDNSLSRQKKFEEKVSEISKYSSRNKIISRNINYSKMISYESTKKEISTMENYINLNSSKYRAINLKELKPGAGIKTQFGDNSCSVGFRTIYNGKVGYVTAGHCVRVDGLDTTLETGNVKLYQYQNNQKYDYAFVEINSKYTVSNTLAYRKNNAGYQDITLLVSNSTPATPVGTAIAKVGVTTKYTAGTITRTNITETRDDGKTISGLIESSMKSQQGDSGGTIFKLESNKKDATLIGVLNGGKDSNTTSFTHIGNLPYALLSGRY